MLAHQTRPLTLPSEPPEGGLIVDSTQPRRPLRKRKPNDTCDRPDCGAPFVARGMCRKHYVAWYRATPKESRTVAPGFSRMTVAERFWSKVEKAEPDACWPFTGTQHRRGHGQFFVSKARGLVPAHGFALELVTGQPCPPGLETCHHCDNPPCCNPAHLYFGTRQQNVDDMWARNRGRRGSRTAMAKLTEDQVIAIRERFAAGETSTLLGAEYGVKPATISYITTGRNWKHVGGPITVGRPGRRPRKEAA